MTDDSPNFTLANDAENLLPAAALAKKLGVSTQTIYNYEALGMAAAKVNADGVKVWDAAKAEEFRRTQAPEMRHGGKREGAGRKKTGSSNPKSDIRNPKPEEENPLSAAFDKARAIREAIGEEGLSSRADFEQAFGDQLLEEAMKGTATKLNVTNFSEAIEAREKLLKFRQLEGTLVDVEGVKQALGQFTTTVRLAMEAYPARVAPELVAEFRIDPKLLARVKGVLAQAMRHVMRQIAAEPLIGKGGEKKFTTEGTESTEEEKAEG